MGIVALFKDPAAVSNHPFWEALKDIGPAIAGSWVLAAGVLTVTSAWITARAAAREAADSNNRRRDAIRQVCIGEIKSFWDRANQLELRRELEDHLRSLREIKDQPDGNRPSLLRRSLGDDWFLLSRVDTLAVGELDPEICARYLALSAKARDVVSQFNWLNIVSHTS